MSFWDSKLITDMENGKLPEVPVTIQPSSIIMFSLALLIVATIIILVNNIFNAVYESNGYGGNWYEDGVEKSWSYYFPQAGTNFMVRLGLKF